MTFNHSFPVKILELVYFFVVVVAVFIFIYLFIFYK